MNDLENVKKIAKKCLNCSKPQCVKGCPLKNPIPAILAAIRQDDFKTAEKLLFDNTNGSIICSRLCDFKRNCFGNCVLSKKGEGVKFYEVEKFLSKNYLDSVKPLTEYQSCHIAIIGGGLAGISCAIDFAKKGYLVTIFEKRDKIGGVLTETIPTFRFDHLLVEKYLEALTKLGVEIVYEKQLGQNLFLEDLKAFKYVIFAMGTPLAKDALPSNPNLIDGMAILRNPKNYEPKFKNKKILVIGGGNVAMDLARTIKKMEANVHIVYRRDLISAPANVDEIKCALNEGIVFEECLIPISMNENYLEVEHARLIDDEKSARKQFVGTNSFAKINCDYVVQAIGLNADYAYLKTQISDFFDEAGYPKKAGLFYNHQQVFLATGDFLIGASSFAKTLACAKDTVKEVEQFEKSSIWR